MQILCSVLMEQPPIVIMHGVYQNAAMMLPLVHFVKKMLPDRYVLNCEGISLLESMFSPIVD